MTRLIDHPSPSFGANLTAATVGLSATTATHTAGAPVVTGSTATVPITTTYRLAGTGSWTTHSDLHLDRHSGHWRVEWSPAAIYPSLSEGDHLSVSYTWPPRAPILGAGGAPLTSTEQELNVGIEGSRVTDPAQLSRVLEAAGASQQEVSTALTQTEQHPSYFEPVFQMTEDQFDRMGGRQSQIYTVAGTVFQPVSTRAAITPGLSAHLVGSVGPVTAEELRQLGPAYSAGDLVGQTGLEAAYEARLAGSPGATVSLLDASGRVVSHVEATAPTPGSALVTSVDPGIQEDAEAALSGLGGSGVAGPGAAGSGADEEAALVAVQASTGKILASVSNPSNDQFDQALDGEFPPGSTFKVLTASALIELGLSPSSPATCPPSITVDGLAIHNAEGDAPVSTLGQAFAESCNTAFVQLATSHLQPRDLPAVAALYGIGVAPRMGLSSFPGAVPSPTDTADLAASAIGQGSIVVSPLDMAMVAASVDSGSVRPAELVVGSPDDPSTGSTAPGRALPSAVVEDLRQMMASVVTDGTAAGTGLPSGTYAKTGTAQYGSGDPLPTDAWLIGYRGDVAFAMVVHDSKGNGGPVDGPVVARFLDGLPAAHS